MCFEYYILLALLPLVMPRKAKGLWTFIAISPGAFVSGWSAVAQIMGVETPLFVPLMNVDAAIFSLLFSLIFLMVLPGVAYGLRRSGASGVAIALHWSVIVILYYTLQGILMAQSMFGFLFYWELMSIALFLLVAFDSVRREVMHSATSLLIIMHAAFFVLVGAFAMLDQPLDLFGSFGGMEIVLFVMFLVVFMVKSGVFPFHFWLPRTYTSAPWWISALMGGAVTNIGIYGIIRVMGVVDDLYAASLVLIVVGAVSALYGAMRLPSSHSLLRLLSYSSIDNIGLILLAFGVGFYGQSTGNAEFAMWGFIGGSMQLVFHALAKSLLFLSAGQVIDATSLDRASLLGGLVHTMPGVSLMFALGSMSLMAILPMAGFWGEFAIFSSLLNAVGSADEPVVGVVLMVVVAICAAITIFAFAKTFGVAFLGVARTKNAEQASPNTSFTQRVSQLIYVLLLCFGGGFLMWALSAYGSNLFDLPGLQLTSLVQDTALGVGKVSAVFVVVVVVVLVVRGMLLSGRIDRIESTWSCADGKTDPHMQYTDESFARETSETFSIPGNQRDAREALSRHFRPARVMRRFTKQFALLQTGRTSHYIMHIILFMALVLLLTVTGVI